MIQPITCIWGRKETTQLWLDHMNELGFKPVVCYSRLCDLPKGDMIPVEAPNDPLGNKWQTAVNKALEQKADFYQILGSDDFPSERFYERFEFTLDKSIRKRNKVQFYGLEDMFFLDLKTKYLHYFRYPDYFRFKRGYGTLGGGRLYSSRLLNLINPIYDVEKNSGLDGAGELKAIEIVGKNRPRYQIETPDKEFIGLLNPKNDNSMHPMEFFRTRADKVKGDLIYQFFDLDLVKKMTKLPNEKYEGVMSEKLKVARGKRGIS